LKFLQNGKKLKLFINMKNIQEPKEEDYDDYGWHPDHAI